MPACVPASCERSYRSYFATSGDGPPDKNQLPTMTCHSAATRRRSERRNADRRSALLRKAALHQATSRLIALELAGEGFYPKANCLRVAASNDQQVRDRECRPSTFAAIRPWCNIPM